jgi:hypothetical protein
MRKNVSTLSKTLLILVVTMWINGCTNVESSVTTSGCAAFGKIYPSRADTDGTKRQILTHNETYDAVCSKETK